MQRTISLVSVPFSGHLKIITKLAKELLAQDKQLTIKLIVTSWDNVKMSSSDAAELEQAGIKIIELSQGNIEGAQPMAFTFPRVAKLSDQVLAECKGSDYIVYDFFAMEGYIAGKVLNIPAICSVPAIMGPFDPNCTMLKDGIAKNAGIISALESKYHLEIANKLEMASDGFLLPSDYQNIQWSWPRFIKAKDYTENRLVKNYHFMRPEKPTANKTVAANKKVIYVSLGTVVTGNLWNNVPGTRQFVRNVFNNIKTKFADNDKYEVIIATGRKVADLFDSIPANFKVFESVPQQEILELADVFVTHGGGNSVNEAIDAETPMVVIPFFGDQHLCADNVAKLGIGIAFAADEADKDSVVDTESRHLERSSMADENAISNAINNILADDSYKNNIKKLKSEKPVPASSLATLFHNDSTLNWQEGDLLYGCNDDRKKLAALTMRNDFYRLCDMRSFSTLFADRKSHDSMPRIIDQYHDVLTNMANTDSEMKADQFENYRAALSDYGKHIQPYLDKLKNLSGSKYDNVIWEMCLAGLEFFIYNKKKTVHFVVGKFNEQINQATRRELEWVKSHWQDAEVNQHVKFYVIKDNRLIQIDPEKMLWFNQRPTPSLTDVAPDKLNQEAWRNTMQQITKYKQHLFSKPVTQNNEKEQQLLTYCNN